ncbi:hypothetical protein ACFYWX_46050 [Streptomyces sp. NPDC002888]|uniref:hypothetical protein n=1 Tax=Streptomyces sp. NPDC002888 TaxID=3364668 RepID=UPI0036D10BE7
MNTPGVLRAPLKQDAHELVLLSATGVRRDLLVVSPETGAVAAGRLMAAAGTTGGLRCDDGRPSL